MHIYNMRVVSDPIFRENKKAISLSSADFAHSIVGVKIIF